MRNWNSFLQTMHHLIFSYFQPTYEELKPTGTEETIAICPKFPAYLWGIETLYIRPQEYPANIISSLPMRNWNLQAYWYWLLEYYHFQPTYEELKLCIMNYFHFSFPPFPAYLWGIETIFKYNIKQKTNNISSLPMRNWNSCARCGCGSWCLISSLPMRNWNWDLVFRRSILQIVRRDTKKARRNSRNFQPTYEELKPKTTSVEFFNLHLISSLPMRNWNYCTFDLHPDLPWISSLPMRNWNLRLSTHPTHLPRFPAYLWGIETRVFKVFGFSLSMISSLPMRNWNWGSCKSSDFKPGDFQPTYEELKLDNITWTCLFKILISSLPMRNWNCDINKNATDFYEISSLPMRNWNSQNAFKSVKNFTNFQPTYEELKL